MRIAIIGTYPPPYGGISIHIQRLKNRLEVLGWDITIFNLGKPQQGETENIIDIDNLYLWLLRQLFQRYPYDIVHLNTSSSWLLRIYFGLILCPMRRKKLIITWHGNDITWPYVVNSTRRPARGLISWIISKLVIKSFKKAHAVICVNENGKNLLTARGVNKDRMRTIPAFIPPVNNGPDLYEIPEESWSFISEHTPVIVANAYQITFFKNQDTYGIDMCIDLCIKLKPFYPNIGFIFALPNIGDHEYYKKLTETIHANEIGYNFLFQHKPCQFYPMLAKSDIFVRPTNTDGDAVSIREALFFNVPTVASNAVPRPEGTVLFETRDNDDLFSKVKDILDNYELYKIKLQSVKIKDNFEEILAVYRSMTSYVKNQ